MFSDQILLEKVWHCSNERSCKIYWNTSICESQCLQCLPGPPCYPRFPSSRNSRIMAFHPTGSHKSQNPRQYPSNKPGPPLSTPPNTPALPSTDQLSDKFLQTPVSLCPILIPKSLQNWGPSTKKWSLRGLKWSIWSVFLQQANHNI